MNAEVTVVGLGELGHSVAVRLADTGRSVAVHDLDDTRVARTVRTGGGLVSDGREGSGWSSPTVLCLLPDSETTLRVLGGTAGALRSGATIVDLSSGDPGLAPAIERAVTRTGAAYLAATVLSGGGSQARRGELELAVGGGPDAVEATRETLRTLGRTVAVLPSAAQAQTLKLVNNFVALGASALLAEAIAVARAAGIAPADCFTWLASGSAANWVSLPRAHQVAAAADRPPGPAGFRAVLAAKDVRYFAANASRHAVPAGIAGAVGSVYTEAAFTGHAETEAAGWPWRRLAGATTPDRVPSEGPDRTLGGTA